MTLRIYNTLSRALEDFVPLEPDHVRMYVCGMTVYDLCHLGHARSMVAFDVVQRWLRTSGLRVTYVRNITDIDDKIIRRALEAPMRQIAENAGVDGAVVAGKVRESTDKSFGFNAQTEEYGDMFKFGVIDPAKVVRTALEDAASIAGLLITTEAMVAEKPEPKGAGGGMPDMGGMGGMGGMM